MLIGFLVCECGRRRYSMKRKPNGDIISATCRYCGRVYTDEFIQALWDKVKELHGKKEMVLK